MSKMSPKEVERRLGLQYAQTLKDSNQPGSIYRDCEEVIQSSLGLLEHYNRVAIAMKSLKAKTRTAGLFT